MIDFVGLIKIFFIVILVSVFLIVRKDKNILKAAVLPVSNESKKLNIWIISCIYLAYWIIFSGLVGYLLQLFGIWSRGGTSGFFVGLVLFWVLIDMSKKAQNREKQLIQVRKIIATFSIIYILCMLVI